jgi:hypothetical protein
MCEYVAYVYNFKSLSCLWQCHIFKYKSKIIFQFLVFTNEKLNVKLKRPQNKPRVSAFDRTEQKPNIKTGRIGLRF